MNTAQKGFTLIELMIVIAIIGILAAIALPAYQNYTARAQATEGFTATSGLQTDIGEYYADKGVMPIAADVATTGIIGKSANDLEGKYFAVNTVTVTADTGQINIPFDDGQNAGDTMTLLPTPSTAGGQIAQWTCGGLDSKYLPTSCQ